jgi:hypothetical protein
MRGDWTRYRFKQQCPVCGHCGWCMYKGQLMSPTAVLCARVSDGCAKRKDGSLITAAGGQGWIHDLKKDPKFKPRRHPVPTNKPKVVVHPMMADLAREFHGAMNDLEMEALGEQLGVSAESLKRLRVGWCKRYMHHPLNYVTGELGDTVTKHAKAFAFPMRDARQRIIGIRFRNQKGYKWAAECSINGLFIPVPLNPDGPLLIVEGPTETAAATDLGFRRRWTPRKHIGVRVHSSILQTVPPSPRRRDLSQQRSPRLRCRTAHADWCGNALSRVEGSKSGGLDQTRQTRNEGFEGVEKQGCNTRGRANFDKPHTALDRGCATLRNLKT